MKSLLIAFSITFALSSQAQDINAEENKYLGYVYQQPGYQLDDPQGDVLLLWTAHQIPKFVLSNLKGKQAELLKLREEKANELLEKYPHFKPKEETKNIIVEDYVTVRVEDEPIELEGHEAPFRVKNVALMMKQVIVEELANGIEPKRGTVHKWSPQIIKELRKKFIVFSRMSKLLIALSRGGSSSYLVTGTEDQLKDYLLNRPQNSVTLEEMFRASYRINQGDVYLTLLTVENILSREWLRPGRSKRALTTKLKDITNFNYKTDKFGSWYHLFGIMLFGYAEGGLKAVAVGNIETVGSQIMGRFADERQETYINSRGGRIGANLRRWLKRGGQKTFEPNKEFLQEVFYLDLDEDFTKRLEKAKKKKQKEAA